ncbi:MAG TPA: PA14 domain-containing protein, partial [Phycisphaerales bacterium]|nr:PA14 domain-containing protein [Phycisphaerales bacterium]
LWWVQPLSDAQPGAPADRHAVFPGDALLPGEHGCPGGVETGLAPAGRAKGGAPACIRATEIAFDADVLFYQQNGSSVAATNADIDSVVNSMNLIYGRDTTVTFIVTAHLVRTAPGLYTSNVPQTLLNQMVSEWQNNQGAVVRDIAHLMTGQPTGSTIGLAFNGAVCSTQFGYGFSQSRYSANFANRVSLTCHEVGHNFSASHCDADPDCAIMCSINGGCAHNVSGFSQRSINEIRPYAMAASCLANSPGIAAAVPPRASPDAATAAPGGTTDIDVLANDFDGNCHTLAIQSFPASTAKGTLTRQVGAGPGGRDLIRYSPFAASSGTDAWTYVVADSSSATATGTVVVTIPPPKAPDYAGPTRAQLDAAYYRLQGRAAVPDFSSLFNFRTNTYTNTPINFASTAGEFASSGRSDTFGDVATATLNVPTAGSWTFFTQSDEGSLLYIDGNLVVNNDFVHTSQERSGVVASLSAGAHALRVEHFELTGPAELIVRWQGPATAKQVIPGNRLSGFQLRFYELPPAVSSIPTLTGMVPVASGAVAAVNFPAGSANFGASGRPSDVGALFTGLINIPTTGLYTFYLESDDASRLTLGSSSVVVNHDGAHPMTEASGQIALLAGLHTFKVEYANGSAPSGLIARWQGPGIAKAVIPAANLVRLPVQCNQADVGSTGGVNGPDGTLDNNDFVVFINYFFAHNPLADLGVTGGVPGSDGSWDNNDFVAFIDYFFSPCG